MDELIKKDSFNKSFKIFKLMRMTTLIIEKLLKYPVKITLLKFSVKLCFTNYLLAQK